MQNNLRRFHTLPQATGRSTQAVLFFHDIFLVVFTFKIQLHLGDCLFLVVVTNYNVTSHQTKNNSHIPHFCTEAFLCCGTVAFCTVAFLQSVTRPNNIRTSYIP